MPYVELDDGVRMWYEIHGRENGRNILLYHGWGASIAFWSEQLPLLEEMGYRIVAIDGRGHGKSDKPRKGYSLERLRQDFVNFQEEVRLDEWAVIGHSAGGGVAQITYHDYPSQTKALVLIDTSFTIVETFQQKLFWNLLPTPLTLTLNPLLRWSVHTLSTASIPFIAIALNKPVETVKRWIHDLNAVPSYVIIEEIKQIVKYNLEEKLGEILIPTCLICGNLDTITPVSMMRRMQQKIPDARLCVIKNAGHMALITQSTQVNKYLKEFLKEKYPPKF
ncbi:MAG TPA: alpha/beta hydrolase [Candidatus Deferrimicrobium sp.]|nr:alpha/beta hydrolase [Candidatus Deferrimicrobium sp.]